MSTTLGDSLRQKAAQIRDAAKAEAESVIAEAESKAKAVETQAVAFEQKAQTQGGIWADLVKYGHAEVAALHDDFEGLLSHL